MLAVVFSILATCFFFGLLFMIPVISIYNHLNGLLNRSEQSFTQLTDLMRRRYELLPPLTARLSDFEKLDAESRTTTSDTNHTVKVAEQILAEDLKNREAMSRLIGAEMALDDVVRRLWSIMDAHEKLSEDEEILSLQHDLSSTDTRLCFARETYNDLASHYNSSRNQFPTRLFAQKLGFEAIQMFDFAGKRSITR